MGAIGGGDERADTRVQEKARGPERDRDSGGIGVPSAPADDLGQREGGGPSLTRGRAMNELSRL